MALPPCPCPMDAAPLLCPGLRAGHSPCGVFASGDLRPLPSLSLSCHCPGGPERARGASLGPLPAGATGARCVPGRCWPWETGNLRTGGLGAAGLGTRGVSRAQSPRPGLHSGCLSPPASLAPYFSGALLRVPVCPFPTPPTPRPLSVCMYFQGPQLPRPRSRPRMCLGQSRTRLGWGSPACRQLREAQEQLWSPCQGALRTGNGAGWWEHWLPLGTRDAPGCGKGWGRVQGAGWSLPSPVPPGSDPASGLGPRGQRQGGPEEPGAWACAAMVLLLANRRRGRPRFPTPQPGDGI